MVLSVVKMESKCNTLMLRERKFSEPVLQVETLPNQASKLSVVFTVEFVAAAVVVVTGQQIEFTSLRFGWRVWGGRSAVR